MKVVTYLINLDGSDDRLKNASDLLSSQGVPFTRFPAFDGRGKALDDFDNYNNEKALQIMGRSLLNAEIGCYLSHIGCVKKFLESDADYLVVLEDDMKLEPEFRTVLNNILKYLDQNRQIDWNVINIGSKKKKICKTIADFDGYELLHAYYFPIRTIGLVWSRKGAQNFMDQNIDIFMPIDNYLQKWLSENGKGLSVWQPLVRPSGFESVIDKNRSTKSKKSLEYNLKKQVRTWKIRFTAINNMLFK